MMQTLRIPRRRPLVCGFALLCCLALSGCFFGKTVIQGPDRVPPPRSGTAGQTPTGRTPVAEAEAALAAGQTARAEQLAMRLTSQPGLAVEDIARVSRVLALSANANNHPYLALNALERWLAVDGNADLSPEWQETFLGALSQLPPRDGQARASAAMANANKPFSLRAGAALFLSSGQWANAATAPRALADLQGFYAQTGETANRAKMEQGLFRHLQDTRESTLAVLDGLVSEENSKGYPYAIIRLETLRRKALRAETREEAGAGIALLAQDTTLADPAILRAWDAPVAVTVVSPLPGRTLVLALPLSGPLAGIGKKITQGADAARNEFAAAGHTVHVLHVDTEDPAWTEKLAALPQNAVIVGGPLRMDRFTAAHASGLTRSRVFLTFMPSLGEAGEEGNIAWRFFSSTEDQFRTLFAATARLGITEYAILMPDGDAYAARMAERFAAHAQASGGWVVKRAEYPQAAPEKWNSLVGSFLGSHKKAAHPPAVPFKAVFLPDSWRNMELIVPNFFYFLESRQLFLGTALWEQGLSETEHVASHYYNLAVFPAAWNRAPSASSAALRLQAAYARDGLGEPDLWAGIGYDFVRFASTLDIGPGWSGSGVNATLSGASGMEWSMAPLRWSPRGRASQDLFLLSPGGRGFAPADMTAIEARFNKAWGQ